MMECWWLRRPRDHLGPRDRNISGLPSRTLIEVHHPGIYGFVGGRPRAEQDEWMSAFMNIKYRKNLAKSA